MYIVCARVCECVFALVCEYVSICVCICMHTGARTHARTLGARVCVCRTVRVRVMHTQHTRAHVWAVWPTITLGYKSVSMHMQGAVKKHTHRSQSKASTILCIYIDPPVLAHACTSQTYAL